MQQQSTLVNSVALNVVNQCMTVTTSSDLSSCKTSFQEIQSECKDSKFAGQPVCNDPRIAQFLLTIDDKITQSQNTTKITDTIQQIVALCSQATDPSTIQQCQQDMIKIKQECSTLSLPICQDVRIGQIMNKSPDQNNTANQSLENFINACMITKNTTILKDCSNRANNIINLCQSSNLPACQDPRLEQISKISP